MSNNYRICSKTIMDTTDPKIIFNEKGKVIIILILLILFYLIGTQIPKGLMN